MLKEFLKLLFISLFILVNFSYSQLKEEKIIFLGHAYGSHFELDKQLDKVVINLLEKKEEYKIDEFIFGGDFIYNCFDAEERENLFNKIKNKNVSLVLGNHDNCDSIKKKLKLFKGDLNYSRTLNDNLFLYINTSISSDAELSNLILFTKKEIETSKPKNILIFCHQTIFSKNDFYLRTNSRKYYEKGNLFYEFLQEEYKNEKHEVFLFTGDIGAFSFTPYSFYSKDENFNLYAVGLGNKHKKNGIQIDISDKLEINFIDLKNQEIINPKSFGKLKMQIYQFPKLILFHIKSNLKITIVSLILCIFVFIIRFRR